MRYMILLLLALTGLWLPAAPASAQANTPPDFNNVTVTAAPGAPLAIEGGRVLLAEDAFGQMVPIVEGRLVNNSDDAYTNILLLADLYDEFEVLAGEGVGGPVNACGAGLLADFALQPGRSQPFRLFLEIFDDDPAARLIRVEIDVQATPTDPTPPLPESVPGVNRLTPEPLEVVRLEWLDEITMRYGVGCHEDLFTELDWYLFSLVSRTPIAIQFADAALLTPRFLEQAGLADPAVLQRSSLTFAPGTSRGVFQNELNTIYTIERNGSFRRLVFDNLARFSLQQIKWMPGNQRFVAIYYGALGDDVRYFTAGIDGQRISRSVYDIVPSRTVPGVSPDGTLAVITTTIDDVTGYYLAQTNGDGIELLFEAEPPGNNWPSPIYVPGSGPGDASIYITRPIDGVPTLECLDLASRERAVLAELPLIIDSNTRAQSARSPRGDVIALAANGVNGGLWGIDISSLPSCPG